MRRALLAQSVALALSVGACGAMSRADDYIAFSLGVAERRIQAAGGLDWRKEQPEVFTLGGITKIRGLVHERETGEIILVGEQDPERSILTVDDFAVALRARFVYDEWPLVSIDPTPDTPRTNMQHVRYEGGVEDTAFGLDMFDADLRLKKIDLGLLESGVVGLKGTWDMNVERTKQGRGPRWQELASRCWFYPTNPSVAVREDVVAIEGLRLGVLTEVLSASIDGQPVRDLTTFVDPVNDRFAQQMSEHYDEVARAHPSIRRLAGLAELVALTRAIEDMRPAPDCSYWLREHQVVPVATPREQELLTQRWDYELGNVEGRWVVSGGVHLTAIALRLEAGDVAALREASLASRPEATALSWVFGTRWAIEGAPAPSDFDMLCAQAVFLHRQRRYDDAITLYDQILELDPMLADTYINRGEAYLRKGEMERATADYDEALTLDPGSALAHNNRAVAYMMEGNREEALKHVARALELNPDLGTAYLARGVISMSREQFAEALADLTKAVELAPHLQEARFTVGLARVLAGQYEEAVQDLTKAIEMDPLDHRAYQFRGDAYYFTGKLQAAAADWARARVSAEGVEE